MPVRLAICAALAAAAVLVTVAAGAIGATVAAAATPPTAVSSHYQLASKAPLALAGGDTLVASFEPKGDDVVLAIPPGGRASVIARVQPNGEPPSQIDMAASSTRFALLEEGVWSGYKDCCVSYTERILAGPLFGPPSEQTAGCLPAPGLDESVTGEVGVQAHYAIALDGDLLAYDSYGCVVVEDLASGLQRIVRLQATLDPVLGRRVSREPTVLAAAGRLIAYRVNGFGGEGPGAIAVYDVDSGQELYRVPVPAPEASTGTSFALQSDGTLVISEASSCHASISTVAEPTPRPFAIPACAVYGLIDGRLLAEVAASDQRRSLGWTTLQAPAFRQIVDLGPDGLRKAATPVFSGTEAVYALTGCWSPTVYRTPLSEPGTPPPSPSSCPISAPVRAALLTSKTLRVRLHCPLGCSGYFDAYIGTPKQVRAERGGQTLEGSELPGVSIPPGGSATLTLLRDERDEDTPTASGLARRLRGEQRLDLRLNFELDTPASATLVDEQQASELGIAYRTSPQIIVPIHLRATAR